jgi:uncharacterized membrane protein
MFTVVDLFQTSPAIATDINEDGWVSGWATGLTPFIFVPQQPNSAAGTTVQLTPPAGISGQALGINNRVDVVGWTGITLPQGLFEQAALWRNCGIGGGSGFTLKTLSQFAGVSLGSAHANAINDSRIIVGWSEVTLGGTRRAVLWDGDHPFDPPNALQALDNNLASEAFGINDQNTIVGSSQTQDPAGNIVNHAVVWDANTLQIKQDLGTLASVIPVVFTDLNAEARAINDNGTIVGVGDLTNPPTRPRAGFIVPMGGTMQLIPMLPSPSAGAWDVSPNDTAAVTITVLDLTGQTVDHGATFSLQQGLFDIGPLSGGWLLSEARGVNDHGQICGRGSSPFTFNHALLLAP